MSFDPAREAKKAYEDYAKEINKNLRIALDRTMAKAEDRLNEIIQEKAIQNFYEGYFPHVYNRTWQLPNAIKAYTEDTSTGDTFKFTYGPILDESTMDHSHYSINVTYAKGKGKNKKFVTKTYNIKLKKKPDEERIMEMTLGEGYHPSVGTADTMAPIYNKNDDGVLVDAFEEFMKEIPDIFNAEMDKLM